MLVIIDGNGGMRSSRPTLQMIIRAFKTIVTRQLGFAIWQESFHDHIIRNEKDYLSHYQYIDDNPAKWLEDEYEKVLSERIDDGTLRKIFCGLCGEQS